MDNSICISFYLREAAIRLHRKMLDSINSPSFVEFLISDDRKTLQIGQDSEGGYLVPEEFERRLIEALEEENVFRMGVPQTIHRRCEAEGGNIHR